MNSICYKHQSRKAFWSVAHPIYAYANKAKHVIKAQVSNIYKFKRVCDFSFFHSSFTRIEFAVDSHSFVVCNKV